MPVGRKRESSVRDAASADFALRIAAQGDGARKRDRTRAALHLAGCRLLARQNLSDLKVADICREAGVAHGTFYLYFADRHDFLGDLLMKFVAFVQEVMLHASKTGTSNPERAATAAYLRLFEANPGLMNGLMNHLDAFPECRDAFQKLNREWAERVVQSVERRGSADPGGETVPRDELLRRAYALGAMVDQYLAALILDKDKTLTALSRDREAVIDTLSHIWKRGMLP